MSFSIKLLEPNGYLLQRRKKALAFLDSEDGKGIAQAGKDLGGLDPIEELLSLARQLEEARASVRLGFFPDEPACGDAFLGHQGRGRPIAGKLLRRQGRSDGASLPSELDEAKLQQRDSEAPDSVRGAPPMHGCDHLQERYFLHI